MQEQLLVSTGRALLWIAQPPGEVRIIHQGKGTYYGIAYSQDVIYVAARGSMTDAENNGEILLFDHRLNYVTSLKAPFPMQDMHQIVFARGKLWVTCTYHDLIAIYDGNEWETWHVDPSAATSRGRLHLNSIYVEGDDIYVLAHQHGPSTIYRYTYPDLSEPVEVVQLGVASHNIWINDGDLYTCSSFDGLIVSRGGFCLKIGEYPRGVAVGTNRTYVGVSRFAGRENRDRFASWIRAYDANWAPQTVWRLESLGQVTEIRLLGDQDRAMPDSYIAALDFVPGYPLEALEVQGDTVEIPVE